MSAQLRLVEQKPAPKWRRRTDGTYIYNVTSGKYSFVYALVDRGRSGCWWWRVFYVRPGGFEQDVTGQTISLKLAKTAAEAALRLAGAL